MNRKIIVIAIILCFIGAGIASGVVSGMGSGATTTAKPVEIVLGQEIKDKLASLSVTDTNVCVKTELQCVEYEPYPSIMCLELKDPKQVFDPEKNPCLKWEDWKAKGCVDFDEKKGECLKWDIEQKCLSEKQVCVQWETQSNPRGIVSPTITPIGCNTKECCYNLTEEPYYHRYNTCIPADTNKETNEANIVTFVEKDLKQIAKNTETDLQEKSPDKTPEPIYITIK